MELPSLSIGRMNNSMAPEVGLVLVVGGVEDNNGTVTEGLYRDLRNPQTTGTVEAWELMAGMPVWAEQTCMTYFKGHFIIAGGSVKGHNSDLFFCFKATRQKEYEDGCRGNWVRLSHMQRPREFEGLVATRNILPGFGKHE